MFNALVTTFWAIGLGVFAFGLYTVATDADNMEPRPIACVWDDSEGEEFPCYWDAEERSNGVGHSFTKYPDGRIVYDVR